MDIDISVLRLMEREKEISFELLASAIEEALLSAYEKTDDPVAGARVELNRRSGHVAVMVPERDEDGQTVGEYDGTPDDFGRVAAATARQVIFQRLRDAEDEQKYGHFSAVEGDIVVGVVQQGRDSRTVLVDLGKTEAIMPLAEQVPGERYTHGTRLRVYVVAVRRELRGSAGRREPDAPGAGRAAVRARGARDRRRHRGDQGHRPRGRPPQQDRRDEPQPRRERQGRLHRPDGLPGPGDHARAQRREDRHRRLVARTRRRFVGQALSPAKVTSVTVVDEALRSARVVVPDYQLSLAIGREGQNARLAARLTGWRIDIRPDTEVQPSGD